MSGEPRPDRPLLSVEGLRVGYRTRTGSVTALRGVDLSLHPGEVLAVVGESGSGKSTLAQAVSGLLPPAGTIEAGRIRLSGTELLGLGERAMGAVRGRRIGWIPQDPGVSLNPVQRVGTQVAELLRIHRLADRRRARLDAVELLADAGLSDPELRARQYPHQLSGGMRQRVLIAIAIAARPELLIADEPTSALDVTVQQRILDHLGALTRRDGTAMVLITHDLGVAADRADRVVVLRGGRVVEHGPVARVLREPEQNYTRELVHAVPGRRRARPAPTPTPTSGPVIEVTRLARSYRVSRGRRIDAVRDVTFTIGHGETLALVGESGSGKSTTARLVLGLERPDGGRIRFDGEDVTDARGERWRALRRRAQLVQQNPYSALNPRFTVEHIITEPLRAFRVGTAAQQRATAEDLTDRVALPAGVLGRRPSELSGGQRQRVAIARALALSPELVVCDEPVSALDVSVQARVLELLARLQDETGVSYLFISHDLAVVRGIAHRVAVMRAGRIVEQRPTEDLFADPRESYTVTLLNSMAGGTLPTSPRG